MSLIKTQEEIEILKEAGRRLATVLEEVKKYVVAGVATKALDQIAEKKIREYGDVPSFLNHTPSGNKNSFPASLCVSVNEEVVHGIPSLRILQEGDIVGLDIGLTHKGLFVDMAVTVPVGAITKEEGDLIQVTKDALYRGIDSVRAGAHIGAIGATIEDYVTPFKYGIVRELGGHGVGHAVHEEPYIPNFGNKNSGIQMQKGMVLALEPMLTLGSPNIKVLDDEYTIITKDKSKSAHFEHTVLVTDGDPVILTKQ